jgi:hypothetical protein
VAGSGYIYTAPLNPTYSWSPAAGLSSTTASLVTASGITSTTIYSLDLNVQGCVAQKTIAVNVYTTPVVSITSNTSTVCPGGSATLTPSGAPSYSWNTGATTNSLVVTPALLNANVYTVTGINGACSANSTISVTRLAGPTMSVSGPTGICPPDNATLTVSGALTYTWSTTSNSTSIVVSPTVPSQYTVSGTDAQGCIASLVRPLNVNTSLALNGTAPSTACAGQSITISINGADTYSWSTSETTGTITPAPTANTTYSVVGTSGSCTGSIAVSVSVIPMPTVNVTGNFTVCAGQTVSLTATGATTYSWSTGSTNASITTAPLTNSLYTVRGFNGACTMTVPVSVVSNSLPVITISQPSASVCFSTPTTFTANGAANYTWTNGPQTSTITVTPTVATIYTVTGVSSAGCVSTKTVSQGIFALPSIGISPNPATVCVNTPFTYTGTGGTTYTWNGTTTGGTISLAAASNTAYTIVGANANGCLNSATVAVTTLTVPIVTISPSSATVCSGSATSFTASGANSFMWNGSASGSVFVTAPVNNTVVSVVGTNTDGCASSATVAVSTLTVPVLAVNPPSLTMCAYSTATVTASGALTYTWSTAVQTASAALTPTNSTLYTVSGTNPQGCISSAGISVLTNSLPAVNVTPGQPTVCANAASNFTATGADTYTWSTGPQTNTVAITPTANTVFTVSGTNTITTCVGTKTFAVFTYSAPVLNVLPALSASACPNGAVTFTASGAATFSWNTGSFGPVISISPTGTAVYTVTGKSTQNCFSSKTVTVGLFPVTNLTASASSTTICAKESVTLTAQGAVTYTWLPYNSSSAVFTLNLQNTTKFTLMGTDANGCAAQDSLKVTVDKCTGIAKNAGIANMISVFPNPTNGNITATFGFEGTKTISVINSVGAVVEEVTTSESAKSFDLTEKAKGIYFIRVTSGTEEARFKIVVQ